MHRINARSTRLGAAAVYVLLAMVGLIAMAALAVDMGMLYSARSEMQRAADAAALSGANVLLNKDRLTDAAAAEEVAADSLDASVDVAQRNVVLKTAPSVNENSDVQLGKWDAHVGPESIDFNSAGPFNAVAVWVKRDASHGGSIALGFGSALGLSSKDLSAYAVAGFADAISGFEVANADDTADLLPFTLHEDWWNGLLNGSRHSGDQYSYNPETKAVTSGGDGILELNLYPGAGSGQLPPGNFGTVDLGSPNNSAADLARQILYGVSQADLAYFGGRIEFGSDGTFLLNGDTGLTAGVKDELEAIKGQPRAIPIFRTVSGNGNNAMYTIVAWGGIRIMDVKLTGSMSSKRLIIQPANVVDESAVAGSSGDSNYVYRPVQIVR